MIQTDVSDQAIYMCVSRMHKAATQLKKGKNKDEVTNFLHRQFKVPVIRKEDEIGGENEKTSQTQQSQSNKAAKLMNWNGLEEENSKLKAENEHLKVKLDCTVEKVKLELEKAQAVCNTLASTLDMTNKEARESAKVATNKVRNLNKKIKTRDQQVKTHKKTIKGLRQQVKDAEREKEIAEKGKENAENEQTTSEERQRETEDKLDELKRKMKSTADSCLNRTELYWNCKTSKNKLRKKRESWSSFATQTK